MVSDNLTARRQCQIQPHTRGERAKKIVLISVFLFPSPQSQACSRSCRITNNERRSYFSATTNIGEEAPKDKNDRIMLVVDRRGPKRSVLIHRPEHWYLCRTSDVRMSDGQSSFALDNTTVSLLQPPQKHFYEENFISAFRGLAGHQLSALLHSKPDRERSTLGLILHVSDSMISLRCPVFSL